jgi:hypothetical protein
MHYFGYLYKAGMVVDGAIIFLSIWLGRTGDHFILAL